MGLVHRYFIPALVLLLGCGGSVSATPKLRLTSASIGPVVVASGANGPQQAIDAYNVGDGGLALTANANVAWISAAVGEAGNCALRPGPCTPIRMDLNTAGLAKGLHTGLVTISEIKADPAGLAQGIYKGSIEVVSNAANNPYSVPVVLEVMAAGPPAIDYATVTNLASSDPDPVVAPGMLVKVRGTQITAQEESTATEAPYPGSLGGVQVYVNGIEGAVLHTASDELWFQVPYEVEPGAALVQLVRDGQVGNFVEVTVVERAPRIEPAAVSPYAKALLDDGVAAMPESAGGRPAKAGDALTVSMIGLGRTEPAVATGTAPADPAANIPGPVLVSFGANLFNEGVVVEAASAQLIPGSPGRYAVKVTVPPDTATGDRVALTITAGGVSSNRLHLAIQ